MSFQTRKTFIRSSEHKLRYFWWNPRAFWPSIDNNVTETFPDSTMLTILVKIVHVTLVSNVILQSYENSFCFVKLWLNHWCHMDYFNDVLTTFLGLGTFQLCCCLWSLRKLLDFIKNILICVPKMNKFLMDLERHEGVINDRIFILGELFLKLFAADSHTA